MKVCCKDLAEMAKRDHIDEDGMVTITEDSYGDILSWDYTFKYCPFCGAEVKKA